MEKLVPIIWAVRAVGCAGFMAVFMGVGYAIRWAVS